MLEHGRQWFRSLEFTTDTAHCLADLPAEAVRLGTHPRPHWEAGDPAREQAPAASLVILRSLSKEEGAQIFIAARFLRGLLPEALLLQYNFWLRQDGAMTGQRRVERPQSAAGTTGTTGTDMGTGLGGEVDQADAELTAVEVAAAEAAQGESDELRVTLRNGTAVVRRVPIGVDGQPRPDEARRLLATLYARPGSALAQLVTLLARAEDLSHILAWSGPGGPGTDAGMTAAGGGGEGESVALELLELPRLRLAFDVRRGADGNPNSNPNP